MAKRKQVHDANVQNALPGLGRPKRVKLSKAANKENLVNVAPMISKPIKKPGPKSVVASTRTVRRSPRRKAMQVKNGSNANVSNLRQKHPISKHVTRSDLYNYEDWIQQQERLFTSGLNRDLKPDWRKKEWDEDKWESIRTEAFDYYQSYEFSPIVAKIKRVF